MSGFFQVFYAVFSGILTSLAIPNEIFYFGSPFFGIIALVPLYLAVREAKTYKRAAILFGLDAITTHLLSSFWLANFKDFAIFTLGASAAGTFCIEAMAGFLYFAPFAQNKSRQQAAGLSSPFSLLPVPCPLFTVPWFACVRVVYEWAKSTGFLAYPWGVLSMSAFNFKILMQSADIFGVYGITFLFAFIAGTIAETVSRSSEPPRKEKKAFFKSKIIIHYSLLIINLQRCSLAMLICLSLYGTFKLNQTREPVKTLNAVLVQQNKDPWAEGGDIKSMKISMKLSEKGLNEFEQNGKKCDIVVWSEAVLRHPFPQAYIYYTMRPKEEPLVEFIKRMETPFLIGGSYLLNEKKCLFANSALMFNKDGDFTDWYGKTHLVPFAEVIPWVEYPIVQQTMERLVGFSNGWTPGGIFNLFDANGVRFATPICFEDAFPDICGPLHKAGAEVFMNITDDSWSKTNSAEYQHFVVATFRAIEYRTTLVRSTNAGFTAVVDPCGRVLQSLPLFEEAYLCTEIPVYAPCKTVYAQFTNWFVYLIMIFMAVVYCAVALQTKRKVLDNIFYFC